MWEDCQYRAYGCAALSSSSMYARACKLCAYAWTLRLGRACKLCAYAWTQALGHACKLRACA
eukprot:364444-Chlamydomonas_euryale.AAC.13